MYVCYHRCDDVILLLLPLHSMLLFGYLYSSLLVFFCLVRSYVEAILCLWLMISLVVVDIVVVVRIPTGMYGGVVHYMKGDGSQAQKKNTMQHECIMHEEGTFHPFNVLCHHVSLAFYF